MFDAMRAFQVVDRLAELFVNGRLPISQPAAGHPLSEYWTSRATRISEVGRRNLYARVLGMPGGTDEGDTNRDFGDLWARFISSVSALVRQAAQNPAPDDPVAIDQAQVRKAARDLAGNLSLHGGGAVSYAARELQQTVRKLLDVLNDPEIQHAYGARDAWQVIDRVASLELGRRPATARHRARGQAAAVVFSWLARRGPTLAGAAGDVIDLAAVASHVHSDDPAAPTDADLADACEQWLAVTGVSDGEIDDLAEP
jgi:hypothetical protein